MFLDRFRYLRGLRNAPAMLTTAACSLVLLACGGGGGGSNSPGSGAADPFPKPAELSLVVGNVQAFNGTGAKARITQPDGIAVDSAGTTYITESGLHSVRRISPAGVISVFAGDAVNSGSADGAGAAARFSNPGAIAVDKDDNMYVLDTHNSTVRKVSPAGLVTTVAGSPGQPGSVDGKGSAARFSGLTSIAVDPTGGVFVSETSGTLRKITTDGSVVTLVTPLDTSPLYDHNSRLAADNSGNLFIASGTSRSSVFQRGVPLLHKLTPAGVLSQVYAFSAEDVDGAVYNFGGIAVDGAGNVYLSNGNFTISYTPNSNYTWIGGTVLKLSPLGVLTTIAGTRGQAGSNDGPGLNANFDEPGNLALDRQGYLVLADVRNGTIRTISSSGVVSTLAGRGPASVDGQGDQAQLKQVVGIASDQQGNVVIAEYSAFRRLSPSGMLTTILTDKAGKFQNFALDSRGYMYATSYAGTFSSTFQYTPAGVKTGQRYAYADSLAVDAQDNLYGGTCCSENPIQNLVTQKSLGQTDRSYIRAFTFDSSGNAYATDSSRSVILKFSPAGTVAILAGVDGKPGYKDGAAGTAQFNRPRGIAVLGTDVYVSDTDNNLIRKISQDGTVTTIAGTLGSPDTVMGPTGSLYNPTYLTTESNNSLLVVTDGKAIVRIRL
jgi:sugar lactone lactonase YvrE